MIVFSYCDTFSHRDTDTYYSHLQKVHKRSDGAFLTVRKYRVHNQDGLFSEYKSSHMSDSFY
jgi:hypothetical protein